MTINQLSVFAENQPGSIAHITQTLANEGVNILGLSLAEAQGFGVLRLIVDDAGRAGEAFDNCGIVYHFTNVVAVSVPHEPGGLARVLTLLSDSGVKIAYMYSLFSSPDDRATLILRIPSAQRPHAYEVMSAAGVRILDEEQVMRARD